MLLICAWKSAADRREPPVRRRAAAKAEGRAARPRAPPSRARLVLVRWSSFLVTSSDSRALPVRYAATLHDTMHATPVHTHADRSCCSGGPTLRPPRDHGRLRPVCDLSRTDVSRAPRGYARTMFALTRRTKTKPPLHSMHSRRMHSSLLAQQKARFALTRRMWGPGLLPRCPCAIAWAGVAWSAAAQRRSSMPALWRSPCCPRRICPDREGYCQSAH